MRKSRMRQGGGTHTTESERASPHLGHQLEIALVHFVNLEGARAARVNAQQDKLGRARHPPRVERRKVDALGHVLDELGSGWGVCEKRTERVDAQSCHVSRQAQAQDGMRAQCGAPEERPQTGARHLSARACPRAPWTTRPCGLVLWLSERDEEGCEAHEHAAAVGLCCAGRGRRRDCRKNLGAGGQAPPESFLLWPFPLPQLASKETPPTRTAQGHILRRVAVFAPRVRFQSGTRNVGSIGRDASRISSFFSGCLSWYAWPCAPAPSLLPLRQGLLWLECSRTPSHYLDACLFSCSSFSPSLGPRLLNRPCLLDSRRPLLCRLSNETPRPFVSAFSCMAIFNFFYPICTRLFFSLRASARGHGRCLHGQSSEWAMLQFYRHFCELLSCWVRTISPTFFCGHCTRTRIDRLVSAL
jgi:hypothetical protein